MGVKIQRPGEPGHPGRTRKIYVRVHYKRLRKTRVFNTKKGAEDYAATVKALLKLGKTEGVFTDPAPEAPAAPVPTFTAVVERWRARRTKKLKAGTLETYENILSRYLVPVFGSRPVTAISGTDIDDWWAKVQARGLSKGRLINIRTVVD